MKNYTTPEISIEKFSREEILTASVPVRVLPAKHEGATASFNAEWELEY